jgi:outer membrane receptor protein involved in Fe transport
MRSAFDSTRIQLWLTLAVLGICAVAFAQGGSGELTGLITDSSGAVVSGVEVKLTNSATGEVRTTTSTPAGIYSFPALPIVGFYKLEISAKGFKSTNVQNIVVSVGTITARDLRLEVGASTEQVTVEAGQQIVESEDSSLSQLIDRRVWENMPLEARNSNDFINLVAGAVPEQIAGGTFRGASVNGVRTGAGNYMVEGVDNNEQGQGGVAICGLPCGQGGANTSISPDAIEEYRVITHDYSAEYGKVGGFVTDTVLKSGTNKWHGSLFEYNRIQALAAEDWFSNAAGVTDHLVRNQFGGSVGGPIIRDKTFFYASIEEHRYREAAPNTGASITQQFYNFVNTGQLATYVNSIAPCNTVPGGCPLLPKTLGPMFSAQLQQFPLAFPIVNSNYTCAPYDGTPTPCTSYDAWGQNDAHLLGNYPVPIFGTATESLSTPLNQFRFSIKLDHTLTGNDRLGATYLFENVGTSANFGGSSTLFGVPLDNPNRAQTLGITWTHTLSPTALNQFKIGYVRRTANFTTPSANGVPTLFSIDPEVGGFGGAEGFPQFFTENQFQYKDDISITRGKHQLKFGGEYRRTRNGSSFNNDEWGHFANWGVESLMTDGVFTDAIDQAVVGGTGGYGGWYYAGAAVVPGTGAVPQFYRGYRANEVAFYGQDDWRVSPRLTLNLGLRWEYFGPPHNFQPNIDSNVYFGNPVTPLPCPSPCNPFFPQNSQYYAYEATATFLVRNTSIWNKDLNNFGPRVGFAWDMLGNQKLVLRAGWGAFYDRIYNNVFENIRFNPPYYADEVGGLFKGGTPLGPLKNPGLLTIPFISNAQFINPAIFPNGLPLPVPRHMDQNLVTPYYMQESFGLQYALSKDFALEANYVGTLGRKLIGIEDRNTFDGLVSGAGSTARPNPLFNDDNARGNYFGSNYNALQLTLRKRFSRGLSFNANYTYSKALDELSDFDREKNGEISTTDVENIRNDYGPADFDVRHRVVVSFDYDLPAFHGNRWIGGWTANGIISWNTGSPIGLIDGSSDANADGNRTDRPEFIGPGSVLKSIVGREEIVNLTPAYVYLDPTQYAQSTACLQNPNLDTHGGYWCNPNLGRGALPGPMFTNIDFGISKNFKIYERMSLKFYANLFDLLNHPNFQNPTVTAGGANFDTDGSVFGQSLATYGDTGGHRVTQLALRFDF